MSETYFQWLARATRGRAWVNNPTAAEIDLALAQGAVGYTTNPGYGGGLLKRRADEVRPVVQAAVRAHDDDEAAADESDGRWWRESPPHWLPIHEASGGAMGWVSIEGAPGATRTAR
ncbi:MAG: hypothetical protein U0869_03890 [Chloroflexota bacterium]